MPNETLVCIVLGSTHACPLRGRQTLSVSRGCADANVFEQVVEQRPSELLMVGHAGE